MNINDIIDKLINLDNNIKDIEHEIKTNNDIKENIIREYLNIIYRYCSLIKDIYINHDIFNKNNIIIKYIIFIINKYFIFIYNYYEIIDYIISLSEDDYNKIIGNINLNHLFYDELKTKLKNHKSVITINYISMHVNLQYNDDDDISFNICVNNSENLSVIHHNLKHFLKYLYNTYLIFKEKIYENKNNYITIPQYKGQGICWFISIITGMCYSNLNKNLIKKKYKIQTSIQNIDKTYFSNFIIYIIKNITDKFRTYNTNFIEDCNLFIELKNKPKFVLDILWLFNYNNENKNKYIFKFFTLLKNLDLLNYGIYPDEFEILIYLYELLNITAKYCIYYDNNFYINNYNEKETDFDIFILDVRQEITQEKLNDYILSSNININDNIIKINDDEYILDYALIPNKNICNIDGVECKHCISAIHYNDKQYIYDSATIV